MSKKIKEETFMYKGIKIGIYEEADLGQWNGKEMVLNPNGKIYNWYFKTGAKLDGQNRNKDQAINDAKKMIEHIVSFHEERS